MVFILLISGIKNREIILPPEFHLKPNIDAHELRVRVSAFFGPEHEVRHRARRAIPEWDL